jgi:hypothetical protein
MIQNGTQWIVSSAHHVLHPIDSPNEMGQIDGFQSTHSDKEILVEIGHAHDFVWDDLTNG